LSEKEQIKQMALFFKPFEEMTDQDYADLGLKAGLEIHQQLLTSKKLFCRCPSGIYSETYDAEILRHMRPTLSELGEYDGTALMEFKTKKNIIYRINHETVCTYEMDDTPPFEINQEALDTALEIAMLMNYKLVSEIHIARKQYLDGSIPTGFQRTTIVGIDGWIPYKDRKIGLIQLGLEEDACREVSDIGHERIYITDRLGMPLIETVTQPALKTPQEVADMANILRWLVRSTGKVRTGIGAARQDVNVSIKGGTRIEIKGVHRIPLIPVLIYNEAMRQYSLLNIKNELASRGITKENFRAESADVTQHLTNTTWDPIVQALKRDEEVHCVNLKGYQGILSYPTQTGRVFSREISDRVRVIACLTRLPNILTSESTEEAIDGFAGKKIRNAVSANSSDGLILVWGNKKDVQTAIQEIIIRAKEAIEGIPSETRQALPDGTNGFERILPGPDRMYPDTDLPPMEIPEERIKKLEKNVPPALWDRQIKYREWGIPEHLIIPIASKPEAALFENIVEQYDLKPVYIACLMFETTKHWKRIGLKTFLLTQQIWKLFFSSVQKKPSLADVGVSLLEKYLKNEDFSLESELQNYTEKSCIENELENSIKNEMKKTPDTFHSTEKKQCYLMGQLMPKFGGFISAKTIKESILQMIQQ
jgi:glutamyl-tRNA(Gln) amidotransferase subunit E